MIQFSLYKIRSGFVVTREKQKSKENETREEATFDKWKVTFKYNPGSRVARGLGFRFRFLGSTFHWVSAPKPLKSASPSSSSPQMLTVLLSQSLGSSDSGGIGGPWRERERVLYDLVDRPRAMGSFGGPVSRNESLNSLFQVALYLPSYALPVARIL